jgi:molecular chaperone IbpA
MKKTISNTLVPTVPDIFDRVSNAMLGFSPTFPGELRHALDTVADTYPPYNLIKVSPEKYRLVMAVAGFSKDDIEVVVKNNTLTISGENSNASFNDSGVDYIHKGIATRKFVRSFVLSENTRVVDVELKDGLLSLEVVYEIPEEQKPKRLEIR